MSSEAGEEIRVKVDALHHLMKSDDTVQQDIKDDLIGFLASRGLLDQKYNDPSLKEPETLHRTTSVHMCPWSTCQATRHGSNK
jgi:hypothetical protein